MLNTVVEIESVELLNIAEEFETLTSLPIWIVGVVFVIYLVIHSSPESWLTLPFRIKNRKIRYLQILQSETEGLSSATHMCLQDVLEARIFQYTVGIYAEQEVREILLSLYNQTSYKYGWAKISLAWRHLEVANEHIRLKHMTKRGRLMLWLNWTLAVMFAVLFAFCFLVTIYYIDTRPFSESLPFATLWGLSSFTFAILSQPHVYAIHARRAAHQITSKAQIPLAISANIGNNSGSVDDS